MTKGPRYFRYDAFLSHNQNDGSMALAEALKARGVSVWHDGDADMSDKHVQMEVKDALAHARFTCVCIGAAFRDSKWVQAEYLSGLEIEREFGADRVMVIALASNPLVPALLGAKPLFSTREIDALAAHLRVANARDPAKTSEPLVAPEVAKRLREDCLKLRSLQRHHTEVQISEEEALKLAQERFERTVADYPTDNKRIGEYWVALAHDRAPMGLPSVGGALSTVREHRAVPGYMPPGSPGYDLFVAPAMRIVERCLVFYERLSERPHLCAAIAAYINEIRYQPDLDAEAYPKPRTAPRDPLFDPLSELIQDGDCRDRAYKAYETILNAAKSALHPEVFAMYRDFGREMAHVELDARRLLIERYAKWHSSATRKSGWRLW